MSGFSQFIGSIFLALIPAFFWGYIFFKKQKEDKYHALLTFLIGAISVFPILIYKALWEFFPWINAFQYTSHLDDDIIGLTNLVHIPLGVVVTFMLVGVIEETVKMCAVRFANKDNIRSIDDSIEFFIIAALGFAFTENILYFYNIWIKMGSEHLFVPFLLRSTFSTFAHIIFSGILGYYYGTAHFAAPILVEKFIQERKFHTKRLHKVFSRKNQKKFHKERIFEGLLIAIFLHSVFNIFLEMNWTFLVIPFLVSGYLTLNYLFNKKENHKEYGLFLDGMRNHQLLLAKQEVID